MPTPNPKSSDFVSSVERAIALKRDEESKSPATAYGYPVRSSKELGLDDYFKKNPHVAGMAWGGGENGSDPNEPRSVVHNPYNEGMRSAPKRDALYKIEASRHMMAQEPVAKFAISQKLQQWRERTFEKGTPYRDDDAAFRETVVSRALVGDTGPEGDMPIDPEVSSITKKYESKLQPSRQKPKLPFR